MVVRVKADLSHIENLSDIHMVIVIVIIIIIIIIISKIRNPMRVGELNLRA